MPSSKFDQAYKQFAFFVKEDDLIDKNVVNITLKAMEIVDVYKDINGQEKKHIVEKMLRKIVTTYNLDEKRRDSLLQFIEHYLSSIADSAIYVSKGKLKVNTKRRNALNCLKIKNLL